MLPAVHDGTCAGRAVLTDRFSKYIAETEERLATLEARVEDRLLQIEDMLSPIKPVESLFRSRNMAQYSSQPEALKRRCAFVAALIRTGFSPTVKAVGSLLLAFTCVRSGGRCRNAEL